MKILILNHHFNQDISELLYYKNSLDEIKYINPNYFANLAKSIFPSRVFGGGLSVYLDKEYDSCRNEYKNIAHKYLFELYKIYQFDIFISPSDTFFYIRDVIDACHFIHVPFIVIQKELGVSPYYFEKHADQIRNTLPVKCDWMTTCSQDSKDFWVKAGAIADNVLVVGQPRFDFYFRKQNKVQTIDSLIKKNEKINILFFSYDLDAYTEEMIDGKYSEPWKQLHDDTIDVLCEISKFDKYNIYIKPHPQYHGTYLNELTEKIESLPNVTILPTAIDARLLICQNDIIVGFQTTALFEAMLLGKKIIYTFWTENVNNLKDRLLKFHEFEDCLSISKSKQTLKSYLINPLTIIGGDNITESILNERINKFESILGISDGNSSKRVFEILNYAYQFYKTTINEKQVLLRNKLRNKNELYQKKEYLISIMNLLKLNIIRILILIPGIGKKLKPYVSICIRNEKLRLNELSKINSVEIIGPTNFSVFFFFQGLVLKKL
ncbi:MAG: hypothetical protein HQ490_09355 [Lutibacter sp.]|nr:hypothetical protein [Lutibacter sp.]